MAEYISKEDVLKFLTQQADEAQRDADENGGGSVIYAECLEDVIADIERISTADVVPVVHGHWVNQPLCGNDNCRCSVCGYVRNVHVNLSGIATQRYCERCGAKMDGGVCHVVD